MTTLPRGIAAQARFELILIIRSGESLLATLGIPLGILVFFSSVEDVLPTGDRGAVEFLVPGVLTISVMSTGLVALAIQTAFERKYGVLKLLAGSPLPRWGVLAGKALAITVLLAGQAAAVFLLAWLALDWQPTGSPLAVGAGLVAGALTFSALGLSMAGALRAEATLAAANASFLLLLLVSGLAFDIEVLPEPLATIGLVLPSGALGQLLRAALAAPGGFAAVPFVVLAGWGAAAAVLAVRTFRWEG